MTDLERAGVVAQLDRALPSGMCRAHIRFEPYRTPLLFISNLYLVMYEFAPYSYYYLYAQVTPYMGTGKMRGKS